MAKIIYEIYQNQVEDHPSNGKYFARVKTTHRRARKYLHPRRHLWRAGEVPLLPHRAAPQLTQGEDRRTGHLLPHGGVRQGRH